MYLQTNNVPELFGQSIYICEQQLLLRILPTCISKRDDHIGYAWRRIECGGTNHISRIYADTRTPIWTHAKVKLKLLRIIAAPHHRLTLPSIPYFSSGRARTTDDGIYWVLVHECLHVHVKSIVLLVLMLLPWCCCYCCGCCHCYWPGFSVFRFRFSKYSLKH